MTEDLKTAIADGIYRAMNEPLGGSGAEREAYPERAVQVLLRTLSDAGYAIVPCEPNEAMLEAGAALRDEFWPSTPHHGGVYAAMIQAAKASADGALEASRTDGSGIISNPIPKTKDEPK